MGPEWSALPWGPGVMPHSIGRERPQAYLGKRGSPGPVAFSAWALALAALVLTAPHSDKELCHSLCMSGLLGSEIQFETTVPQFSLYIL